MVRYSFPVGLSHSLFHAGLSRRTPHSSAANSHFQKPKVEWKRIVHAFQIPEPLEARGGVDNPGLVHLFPGHYPRRMMPL